MWNICHKGVTKGLKSTIYILLGNQYTREYAVNTTQKEKVIKSKSFSIKLWVRRIKNYSFIPFIDAVTEAHESEILLSGLHIWEDREFQTLVFFMHLLWKKRKVFSRSYVLLTKKYWKN